MRNVLGNRVQTLTTGSAPIAPAVVTFIREYDLYPTVVVLTELVFLRALSLWKAMASPR